jgi:hypothetical protein
MYICDSNEISKLIIKHIQTSRVLKLKLGKVHIILEYAGRDRTNIKFYGYISPLARIVKFFENGDSIKCIRVEVN